MTTVTCVKCHGKADTRHLGWRRSAVVSALSSINVVNRHRARLLLGWVTARGQVNRLGM